MTGRRGKTVGVLALQGAVEPHRAHIEAAGAMFMPVKTPKEFDQVDGFILPGGESTTMLKLIDRFDLWDALAEQFSKKPVWGICAGTILIAETVLVQPRTSSSPDPSSLRKQGSETTEQKHSCLRRNDSAWDTQKSFGLLPITVQRNGYGRQIDSHHAQVNDYPVSFIRAPIITGIGEGVDILAEHEGSPVWVQKGKIMASTFHPELTLDAPSPMHRRFVADVKRD